MSNPLTFRLDPYPRLGSTPVQGDFMDHDIESKRAGAFEFTGDWREFAPIALSNLLLSIVTLGIYIFWARTRERKYLWSRTRFIDDRLEWGGTGLELFIGYMLAIILFFIPFAALNLLLQGLLLRDHPGAAALLGLCLYLFLVYLAGVAIFRALRYRLSRTYWHGIRGGSNSQGFAFGWSYLWRTLAGSLALGLLIPWSMTSLWNERWNEMSFGPHEFDANAHPDSIFVKFLLFYLVPVIVFVAIFVGALIFGAFFSFSGMVPTNDGPPTQSTMVMIIVGVAIFYLLFFIVLGVIAMIYYAAYFREVVGKLSLGGLEFDFDARTWDWIKLFLGNFALVVFTLGIGQIFVGYRNWIFFVRHVNAYGEVSLDDFTQSTTKQPGQGEGLLDAFDIGAF
ncbi:YjgN family protein [soil metagenome]